MDSVSTVPSHKDLNLDGWDVEHDGGEDPSRDGVRIDSPLVERRLLPSREEIILDDKQSMAVRERKTMAPIRKSKHADSGGANFRFFVVDHPNQLRNRQEMRENRKHVMHDYLQKERNRPSSTDARVTGSAPARKRKRIPLNGLSHNPAAPSDIFLDPARLTPPSSVHSTESSHGSSDREEVITPEDGTATTEYALGSKSSAGSKALMRRSATSTPDDPPLVEGFGGSFRQRYLTSAVEEIPFPLAHLGGKWNSFNTWPTFDDPRLNIDELKWNCARLFGSKGIAQYWAPMLLRARHAFLSTVCVSSAHDDIMARAARPSSRTPQLESLQRIRVRSEVIQMLQECLQDPDMRTTDATIIAVLHLLVSEIMGCNDSSTETHQKGLHEMVLQRGGINNLGVGGQLASILTITMYLIATLRETPPHKDYITYAEKRKTKPPNNSDPLPESPVYCRPAGYYTINKAVAPSSRIYQLLDDVRKLTNVFLESNDQCPRSNSTDQKAQIWEQSQHDITAIRDRIFGLLPGDELTFAGMSDRNTYEAIRLASRIYAHALANKIPFSEAAAAGLSSASATPPAHDQPASTSLTPAIRTPTEPSPALHIRIKEALFRTDTTECWGHMAGVLFWVSLVAGAAASPGGRGGRTGTEDCMGDEEDARKWLAAIAVRCSILLSFEYGNAMLGTLKRMIAIEEMLARRQEEEEQQEEEDPWWEEIVAGGTGACGPAEQVGTMQRGFTDFAQDFLST